MTKMTDGAPTSFAENEIAELARQSVRQSAHVIDRMNRGMLPDVELPAATVSGEARGGSTAGGVTPSAPGFFSNLRNALRGRPAAGAITHGNARRQRAREHAAAMMATEALSDLTADQAVAIIRMHLRTRPDIEPGALHTLANQLSRHADDIERGRG